MRERLHPALGTAFLAIFAAHWEQLDPAQYPFKHQVAMQLPRHDDRDEFLAGIATAR